ncbi:hypothetical protein FOL47_009917 [Perkinsus chesapeaki]|uniref:Uncharacterized protein n=1 Tax=Perkinsus chesapeaki TaxID=330153 RepID=A0A7J6L5T5_PERCH|nr:hypothetical protein FOL47_009917 [Perkinsus chesapeaki]
MEDQEAMDNYKNNPKKPVFDRQRSVQGSSAGAGSDFFGKYQRHRSIELERLRKMDEDWDIMQKNLEYHRKREGNIKKDIERTEKKRARRMRRKLNKQGYNKQAKAADELKDNKEDVVEEGTRSVKSLVEEQVTVLLKSPEKEQIRSKRTSPAKAAGPNFPPILLNIVGYFSLELLTLRLIRAIQDRGN